MKFELGKYYQHETGIKLHICGLCATQYHGRCFVGENDEGVLEPIDNKEENAVNFHEISKEKFTGDKKELDAFCNRMLDYEYYI